MFRPCIDLHEGKVKQIVGSSLDTGDLKTNFVSSREAAWYAVLFKKDGLTGGHVIMLGPGNEKAAESALKAYPGGLQIGGGIDVSSAASWLDAGASHVIITSWLFENGVLSWDRVRKIAGEIGKQKLVFDLSCRKKDSAYYIVTNRWRVFTQTVLSSSLIEKLEPFCDEFLIHAVDIEGKQQGIDMDLVNDLSLWGSIPVTYAGGARSIADLEQVELCGRGRIHLTVGSALDIFGGNGVKYRDAVEFNRQRLQ